MRDHVLDSLTGRLEVLTRIKVIGMFGKILPDIARHGETNVGVNVDLADGQLSSFAKLIFRNTDRIGHVAAILVDHLDKFLRNRRGAVKNDRKSGQTLDALLEDIKAERRRNENAVSVARALRSLKLVSAVRGADSNGQRVA